MYPLNRFGRIVRLVVGITFVVTFVLMAVGVGLWLFTGSEDDPFGFASTGTWAPTPEPIPLEGELELSSAASRQIMGEACASDDAFIGIVADDGNLPLTSVPLKGGQHGSAGACVFTFHADVPMATNYRFRIHGSQEDGSGRFLQELGVYQRSDLEFTDASGSPSLRVHLKG